MACLHWCPKPATIATMRLYIPSFLFEHFSLVSKPEDGLCSSSAFLVLSSSHLPQHNLLEQVLSRLGCFFLLTSLHQHPKRINIDMILLDGSHNMLQIAQQEALSCCQMSNAQQEALSCCQCSKHSYDCETEQTHSKLLKQQILI